MSYDPDFASVSLLVHANGTNGSSVFTDSSSNALTITNVNAPSVNTGTKKYGSGSMFCDSDAANYITAPITADGPLDLQLDEDWTIEFWSYATSLFRQNILIKLGVGTDTTGLQIQNVNPSTFQARFIETGGFPHEVVNPTTASPDTFNHLALVNYNSTISLYVNGTGYPAGAYDATGLTMASPVGDTLKWGGLGPSFIGQFKGFGDDLRVTRGVARYTSDFTPPLAEFPDTGPPLQITVQPIDTTVDDGSLASFTVSAISFIGPLTFEWYKDFALVDTQVGLQVDSSTTSLTATLADDGSSWYVVVSDAWGSVMSDSVTLHVNAVVPEPEMASRWVQFGRALRLPHVLGGAGKFQNEQTALEAFRLEADTNQVFAKYIDGASHGDLNIRVDITSPEVSTQPSDSTTFTDTVR